MKIITSTSALYTCPEKFRTTSPKAKMTSTKISRAGQNFSGELYSRYRVSVSLLVLFFALAILSAKPLYAADGIISGTVTDLNGNPISEVRVSASQNANGQGWTYETETSTNENGGYTLSTLADGIYRLQFYHNPSIFPAPFPNFIPEYYGDSADIDSASDVTVTGGAAVTGIDAQLGQAGEISGIVTDLNGNPVHDVEVTIFVPSQQDPNGWERSDIRDTTDSNGEYSLTEFNFSAGTYRLEFRDYLGSQSDSSEPLLFPAEFYPDASSVSAGSDIIVGDGERVTGINNQVDMRAGLIQGRVTDIDGNPLVRVTVSLSDENIEGYNNRRGATKTDESGEYAFSINRPSTYKVSFRDNVGGYRHSDIQGIVVGAEQIVTGVDAIMAIQTISGRVTDSLGNPLSKSYVSAYRNAGDERWVSETGSRANENGDYTVTGLVDGTYRLKIFPPPASEFQSEFYADATTLESATDIVVGIGAAIRGIDAQLNPYGTISGRVTDESGSPIPEVSVKRYQYMIEEGWVSEGSTKTDTSGAYTFDKVRAGTYRLEFNLYSSRTFLPQYYSGASTIDAATDVMVGTSTNVTDIDVRLARISTISGTVTDLNGNPAYEVKVTAFAPSAQDPNSWERTNFSHVTNISGEYRLLLSAGTYRLEFRDFLGTPLFPTAYYPNASSPQAAADIVIATGESITDINHQVNMTASLIQGRVTDLQGNPIVGLSTVLLSESVSNHGYWGSVDTDQNGDYTLTIMRPGTYGIGFRDRESGLPDREILGIVVGAEEVISGIDGVMASHSISGRITDRNGNPISAVRVIAYRDMGDGIENFQDEAQTDANGEYLMTRITHGTYRLMFTPDYSNDTFPDADYPTAVEVGLGDTVTGIDLELDRYGTISGRVTDLNGTPLENIEVTVIEIEGGDWHRPSMTDSDGLYVIELTASGTYRVRFDDAPPSDYNYQSGNPNDQYLTQYYPNSDSLESAADVVITLNDFPTLDVQMVKGASISGTITNEAGRPLAGVLAVPYRQDVTGRFTDVGSIIMTDSAGQYRLTSVPPGTYRILFADNNFQIRLDEDPYPDAGALYQHGYHGGAADLDSAADIVVAVSQEVSGIDGQLARAIPAVSGGTAAVTNCVSFGSEGEVGTFSDALTTSNVINFDCSGTLFVPEIIANSDLTLNAQGDVILRNGYGNRVMRISPGIEAEVNNLTLTDGNAYKRGGNILNLGKLTLNNSNIEDGEAQEGGGIYNIGTLRIAGARFRGNGYMSGGGILNVGVAVLVDTDIRNHLPGGATIYNTPEGQITLKRCIVESNGSNSLWAIENSGWMTLEACVIRGNAGPIHNSGTLEIKQTLIGNNHPSPQNSIENWGTMSISESTIANNEWSNVGTVTNWGAATLTNVTVSGNGGIDAGGFFNRGSMTILNSTVTGNSGGDYYDGIPIGGIRNEGSLELSNTIVANQANGMDCGGSAAITSNGHNLASDDSCGLNQATDMSSGNAILGPLQDNGGATFTHAILPGSDAIDAGDCSGGTILIDQRGTTRPQGAACDIGAFELIEGEQPIPTPTPTSTPTPMPEEERVALINQIGSPPVIDGAVDDLWDAAPLYPIDQLILGAVPAVDDLSATWRGLYDSDNLYLLVEVVDDSLSNDSGAEFWLDDVVELYADGDNSQGNSYDDVDDLHLLFRWDDSTDRVGSPSAPLPNGLQRITVNTSNGYRMEFLLPLAGINVTPSDGYEFGIDVHVIDDDAGGDRDHKVTWNSSVDETYLNPSLMGVARLVEQSVPTTPTPTPTPTPVPTQSHAIINTTDSAPQIDGSAESLWQGGNEYPINRPIIGTEVDAADLKASFRTLYDANYLYLFVEVKDDQLHNDSGDQWWEDDVVEVYIDGDNSRGTTYDGIDDYQIFLRWNDSQIHVGALSPSLPNDIRHAMLATDDGYVAEIALPLAGVGITPSDGNEFGLDVQVIDDDSGGSRETKYAWHAATDDAWNNPSLFGSGRFFGQVTPSTPTATPTSPTDDTLTQEAEAAQLSGLFVTGTDADASGGAYIHVPDGAGNRGAMLDPEQKVRFTFNVTDAGLYRIKGWIYAPDVFNNSFYVRVDNGPEVGYLWHTTVNGSFLPQYVSASNTAVEMALAAGDHTIDFFLREDGIQLDKVSLERVDAPEGQIKAASINVQANWLFGTLSLDEPNLSWLKDDAAVLSHSKLVLSDLATNGARYQQSTGVDLDGGYYFDQLPVGKYRLQLTLPAQYQNVDINPVVLELTAGETMQLEYRVTEVDATIFMPLIR